METRFDQIAERIVRISTCIPEAALGGFGPAVTGDHIVGAEALPAHASAGR